MVTGSPFQFTVGPITDGGAHKVRAIGPGLERGEVNTPSEQTFIVFCVCIYFWKTKSQMKQTGHFVWVETCILNWYKSVHNFPLVIRRMLLRFQPSIATYQATKSTWFCHKSAQLNAYFQCRPNITIDKAIKNVS